MTFGQECRPITDEELKRTSVYAISIESWSGKRNWPEQADQSDEWPRFAVSWFVSFGTLDTKAKNKKTADRECRSRSNSNDNVRS
jgi:hypothetical protein